jgi:uncharacterized protein HemX
VSFKGFLCDNTVAVQQLIPTSKGCSGNRNSTMLLPVLAVAGLLGLVAGLAVYLFMQQKQQADEISGAAQPEAAAAAAPRVSTA